MDLISIRLWRTFEIASGFFFHSLVRSRAVLFARTSEFLRSYGCVRKCGEHELVLCSRDAISFS